MCGQKSFIKCPRLYLETTKLKRNGKREFQKGKMKTGPHLYSLPIEVYYASHANLVQEPEDKKYTLSEAATSKILNTRRKPYFRKDPNKMNPRNL